MHGTVSTETLSQLEIDIYSREAILQAQPYFVFRNFVNEKTQLGQERGSTIHFLKYNNIGKGKMLKDEFTPVPRSQMTGSFVHITVNEWAHAIDITRRLAEHSFRDVLEDGIVLLGRSWAATLDEYLRSVFYMTGNVQYAGGGTNDLSITVGDVLSADEVSDAVTTFKSLNIPKIRRGGDEFYVLIAHPRQLRDLRKSKVIENVYIYNNPEMIYRGEIGRFEDVVFVETTEMPVTPGAGSGGIDIYSALLIGDNAVGYAETVPLEIIDGGLKDLKRFITVGWYTVMGAGIIQDNIMEIRTA